MYVRDRRGTGSPRVPRSGPDPDDDLVGVGDGRQAVRDDQVVRRCAKCALRSVSWIAASVRLSSALGRFVQDQHGGP
jgi:hypothetical protein